MRKLHPNAYDNHNRTFPGFQHIIMSAPPLVLTRIRSALLVVERLLEVTFVFYLFGFIEMLRSRATDTKDS